VLEDDPDGRDVATPDSFYRMHLAGILAVRNAPAARRDSARAGGLRK
jgi:hypothetical protein